MNYNAAHKLLVEHPQKGDHLWRNSILSQDLSQGVTEQTVKSIPDVDEQRGVPLDALLYDVSWSKDLVNASPSSCETCLSQLLVNSSINSAKEDPAENFRWNGEQCDDSPCSYRSLRELDNLKTPFSQSSGITYFSQIFLKRSVRTLVEVFRSASSISAWMASIPASFLHFVAYFSWENGVSV